MEHLIKKITVFLLIFFLSWPQAVFANDLKDNSNKLSIDQCIDMALKTNLELRGISLQVEKAQLQQDEAAKQVSFTPISGEIDPGYQMVMNNYQQSAIALSTLKRSESMARNALAKEVITSYGEAVKSYNNLKTARINLEKAMQQRKIASLSKEIGTLSQYDYNATNNQINQLQSAVKAAEVSYRGSIAALAAITGNNADGWEPELVSRANLSEYARNELSVEISRGLEQSHDVYKQKALHDIELIKKQWSMYDTSFIVQDINVQLANIDYEKVKRDTKVGIESRYYAIDALEKQVAAKEEGLLMAHNDLMLAQLLFENGLVAKNVDGPNRIGPFSAEKAVEIKTLELENIKADLAKQKAEFALATGKEVYDRNDWSNQ